MRPILLAILFLGFVGASIALTVMLVLPEIPGFLGVPAGDAVGIWHGLATIVFAVLIIFGASYAGGLLWLILACRLFNRDEVEQFIKAGPNTRLEIWLLERFSR